MNTMNDMHMLPGMAPPPQQQEGGRQLRKKAAKGKGAAGGKAEPPANVPIFLRVSK